MTSLPHNRRITEDGEYELLTRWRQRRRAIEVSGDFGGGTLTVGYRDGQGEFAPFLNPATEEPYTATEGALWDDVPLPPSGVVALKLVGATAPDIKVAQSPNSH